MARRRRPNVQAQERALARARIRLHAVLAFVTMPPEGLPPALAAAVGTPAAREELDRMGAAELLQAARALDGVVRGCPLPGWVVEDLGEVQEPARAGRT